MRKLNLRERIMGLLIVISVPTVYLTMISNKQAQAIAELSSSVQDQTSKVDENQKTLQNLLLKASTAKKAMNSNDDVKRYLEVNQNMSNLLRKLGADEQNRGMILKNISIEDSKKTNNFYQSSMKVEVESSFVALGNFLGALGDNETLIDVKSVVLNRIDTDLKRCTAVIEVKGYFNEGPKL